jgi:hypothetical protein
MKTNATINGEIFVIPNCSISASIEQPKRNFQFWGRLERVWQSLCYGSHKIVDSDKNFYDESWIQVWYCTPGSDNSNWYDHLIDGYQELEGWQPCCQYLPKSLFEGHKEGDVITFELPIERRWHRSLKSDPEMKSRIEMDEIVVSLTLAQTKYRYRNFGPFEEVLKHV